MEMIHHILVPTDFGEPAREAANWATALAKVFHASVTLLYVMRLPMVDYTSATVWPIEQLYSDAKKSLADETLRLKTLYSRVDAVFSEGIPPDTILATIDPRHIDLIVMGTHAQGGISRALLGSVAEKVARFSPVPVLTVEALSGHSRETSHSSDLASTSQAEPILVATDLGTASLRAIEYATELASKLCAPLTLLHVIPSLPSQLDPKVRDEVGVAAELGLSNAKAQIQTRFPSVTTLLREGRPWEEIVATARLVSARLVVVGSVGRRGLSHAFLGSVAEKVVRSSPVPVLTVHPWRFDSREAAGRLLAAQLLPLRTLNPVVVALSVRAAGMAKQVASKLHAPCDSLLTRFVHLDGVVVGAQCENGEVYLEHGRDAGALKLRSDYHQSLATGRYQLAAEGLQPSIPRWDGDVADRAVILVGDVLLRGEPASLASKILRERGASRVILAFPIVIKDAALDVRSVVHDVVSLYEAESAGAVELAYRGEDAAS